ncbi:MAG: diaminopimelate epimerase [Bacteroidales bacterium]|nr:diaminopimelate epimerase [Bacteroidales bacterium]MDD4821564.1 diaminopimelate epimerase [Bacteroidales bacterium]
MVRFTKMQGAGNDYVYINGVIEHIMDPGAFAKRISDRHFGIGSDGLVLILPSETCDFQMRMFNADGTEAEMCGNASRCVGKYVFDNKMTSKHSVTLETKAGVKTLKLFTKGDKVHQVEVDMGSPILNGLDIPVRLELDEVINYPLDINNKKFHITCVSMGNPHAIIYVDNVDSTDPATYGSIIESHPFFPKRTNVEFVEVVNRSLLKMRVWERGAGETLACGTGACATLVASVLNDVCERTATVRLLGGDLKIEWRENGHIYMTGPAVTVFTGEIEE